MVEIWPIVDGFWRRGFFLLLALLTTQILRAAPFSASVVGWGSNTVGQVAAPANLTNVAAIAGGAYHSLAARADGTVVGWGDTNWNKTTPPAGLNNAIAVAAGFNHSVALRSDGAVVAWGANEAGQTNVPPISGAGAIAAGNYFNLALLNGRVVVWGNKPLFMPAELTNGQAFVTGIAAGMDHALAIKQVSGSGRVVAWGRLDQNLSRPPTDLTNGLANVVAVAAGNSHSMALKSDGTVMCWGSNIKGQATPPTGLAGVIAIAAAGDFCLALKSDRTVVGWGANDLGQISPPAALNNVVAIAAGQNHGLALTWAPVSIFAHPQNQTVVAGSTVTFAVGATGSQPMTFQWQRNGTNLPGATNATLVIGNVQTNHAGTYTVLVGNPVGTITSSNAALTVLVPPTITTQPQSQSVPLGAIVSFSVEAAGTPPFGYQWRKEGSNLPNANLSSLIIPNAQPGDQGKYTVLVTNIAGEATSASATLMVLMPPVILLQPQSQTVVAGSSVLFELVATGATTYQWRKNNQNIPGATAAIYPINSAQTNDAGSYTVAVSGPGGSVTSQAAILMVLTPATTNFNLAHWGQSLVFNGTNYVDVTPPGITGVVAIAVGGNHSLALKRDGTIAGWGDNIYGQAAAAGLTSVKAIAAGFNHSLALRSNGTVVAWGQNHQGQASVPVGLSSIIAIAAGVNHSLALRQNGAVIGWGENTFGKATAPPTATNLAAIAAARDHSLALKADGTVVAWGGNDDGQLQAPLGLTNVIAIAAGDHHSLVLKADGTVVGWGALRGLYDYGQANPPPNLSGVMAIAAGGTHSLALLRNNTVVAWGNNNYAQSTIPAGLAGVAAIAAGPTRSLALRLRPLRLHLEKQGGLFRLTAGNLDLSVLAEERLSNLELYTTTNVSLSLSNWTKLTNSLTLANGQAIYLETNGATFQRNYLIIEKP